MNRMTSEIEYLAHSTAFLHRPEYPLIANGIKIEQDCIDLIKAMLDKDQCTRTSAQGILEHPFLKDPSSPMSLHKLATAKSLPRQFFTAVNFIEKVKDKSTVNVLLKPKE